MQPATPSDGLLKNQPIVVPKASDVLAERLRQMILSGQIQPGHQLPAERELVKETSLSRASVREALRILELEGLIETRRGRGGGSVVRRPTGDEVSRSLAVFIRGARVHMHALLQAREAIEPAAAALAAENRTDKDIERLRSSNDRLRSLAADAGAFLDENLHWHLAVVEASHNELFQAFMVALSRAIHDATDIEPFDKPDIREATIAAHERVVESIVRGDAEAARKAMARHVEAASRITLEAGLAEVDGAQGERRMHAHGSG